MKSLLDIEIKLQVNEKDIFLEVHQLNNVHKKSFNQKSKQNHKFYYEIIKKSKNTWKPRKKNEKVIS